MTGKVERPLSRAIITGDIETRRDVAVRCGGDSGESVALLREIRAEMRELRAEVRELRRAQAPLADRLVRAIHRAIAGEPFAAGRLLDLASTRLSTRAELRAVLVGVVGDLEAPGAGRKLGKFLAANSREWDELRLVALGKSRDGLLYRCEFCGENPRVGNWTRELMQE
jgi:hypothetical protein